MYGDKSYIVKTLTGVSLRRNRIDIKQSTPAAIGSCKTGRVVGGLLESLGSFD